MDAQVQSTTDAQAQADLTPVRERAKKATVKTLTAAEKKLTALSKRIDGDVEQTGEFIIANRIAPEFSLTGEAMMSERSSRDVGMGDLVIAHTLKANAKNGITTEQLFQLRQEGMSWGQIAYGLGFNLNATTTAVRSEADVVSGTMKADGKVALIGAPAKAGTNAGANAGTGAHAGPVGTSASSNVGLGVNLGK